MRFVWDEKKNRENVRKHGIDFCDVPALFDHPMLVRLDYGEDRWVGIGLLVSIVAVVVFVEWQDEQTIRIISARKATAYETEQFRQRIAH